MALIKNGIEGTVSGIAGNLVFCSWKGKTYVRTKPVKKNTKRTPLQLKSNNKFKEVQQLHSKILHYIRVGFRNSNNQMSSYNASMSYNLKHGYVDDQNIFHMDWSKFSTSQGIENPVKVFTVSHDVLKHTITITWEINMDLKSRYTWSQYKCMVVIIPEMSEEQQVFGVINGQSIMEKMQTINFAKYTDQSVYHLYLSFWCIDDSKENSNSLYLGAI